MMLNSIKRSVIKGQSNKGLPPPSINGGEPLAISKLSAHPALQTKKRTSKATFASTVT